jgi:hypothetical protein
VPESRHRYLHERLGDHDFQQLVSALLASQFPDLIPMALRQARPSLLMWIDRYVSVDSQESVRLGIVR